MRVSLVNHVGLSLLRVLAARALSAGLVNCWRALVMHVNLVGTVLIRDMLAEAAAYLSASLAAVAADAYGMTRRS